MSRRRIANCDRGYRIAYRWADGFVQRGYFASISAASEHLRWMADNAHLFATTHRAVKYVRDIDGQFISPMAVI